MFIKEKKIIFYHGNVGSQSFKLTVRLEKVKNYFNFNKSYNESSFCCDFVFGNFIITCGL